MAEVSKAEIAKLVITVTKARENMPDKYDGKLKAKLLELVTEVEDLDEEKLTKNQYDKLLAAATKSLKEVVEARKAATKEEAADDKGWTIGSYDDEGDCAEAAKKSIPGVEAAYKKKLKELLAYGINEGHLGVLYEKNLTTSGDKYSFFFKYVRTSKDKKEAKLVGVAIGCHSGSGYVIVKKDGKPSTNKISAQKKNL